MNEFSDGPQTYPDGGTPPQRPAYFPAVGGFRFGLFTIPPEQESGYPEDMEAAMVELETKLPGLMAHMEVDDPGMHTTDTTDFEIVLSGQVILELDDGAEVTLSPGDTVVQNGTRHRWRNPGPNQPSWVSPSSAPTAPERRQHCPRRPYCHRGLHTDGLRLWALCPARYNARSVVAEFVIRAHVWCIDRPRRNESHRAICANGARPGSHEITFKANWRR